MAEQRFSVPSAPTKTAATQRTERAIKQSAIRSERSEQSDRGSCAAVLRRSEPARFSSANDDEVGGYPARSAASEASNQIQRL
jgi:hypothetical protein